jgi:hydroxymethylglutaryl-CoA lyase
VNLRHAGDGAAVALRDVTLRDGLQDETPIPTADKVAIFEALVAAGVRDLELTSFVRPDRVPALADAEQLVVATSDSGSVVRWGLVLNERGATRALVAGLDHLQFVLSVSEAHNSGNAGRSVAASFEALSEIRSSVGADVTVEVTLATAFGCPHVGPIASDAVVAAADRALELGVDGIGLADTIGTGAPSEVAEVVGRVVERAGPIPVGMHLHDTRGLAIANALAALDAGAVRLDASLGGLGGCPFAPGASGNVPIEDLSHALTAEGWTTGLDVHGLIRAAEMACSAVGRSVSSHVARAGPRFETLS